MKIEYHKSVLEEEDGFSNDSAITKSHSAPMNGTGNGFVYKATSNYHPEEAQSLINFNGGESLLSFHQQKEYCLWENDNSNNNGFLHQWNHHQISPRGNSSDPSRLIQDFNCFQTASGYGGSKEKQQQQPQGESSSYGWLYSESNAPSDNNNNNSLQNSSPSCSKEPSFHKRLSMGESMQVSKKQCTASGSVAASKTPKLTKSNISKDPQSIAAKNRRERISERLKILQELVPNGSKVDLVTMLEKAISYVKFLQLQVKVLATDEFWPVQGGKAPDISQVKEAIDAILSSHRDRNSSTSSMQQIKYDDHHLRSDDHHY